MVLEQSYVIERVDIEHVVLSEKRRSLLRFVDFQTYAEVRTDLEVEREFEIVEQFVYIVSQQQACRCLIHLIDRFCLA